MSVLHLVCGMAGAGKTTLAKELEVGWRAVRLCPDEWIAGIADDPRSRAEADRLRDRVEALQWGLARSLLGLGNNVVLENGFWSREERVSRARGGHAVGAKVVLHFMNTPREELHRRIARRNADLPLGSFRVEAAELDRWLERFEAPDVSERGHYDDFRCHGAPE